MAKGHNPALGDPEVSGVPLQNMTRLPPTDSLGIHGKMGRDAADENGNPQQARRTLRRRSHNTMAFTPTPPVSPAKTRKHRISGAPAEPDVSLPWETTKRIDYVIVYEKKTIDEASDKKDKDKIERRMELRELFDQALVQETVEVQEEAIDELVFMKLHVPFKRLCQEAQRIKLEMPLEGCEIYEDDKGCCHCFHDLENKYFRTDDEVDFVSAAYQMDKHFVFEDHTDADKFFRPGLRGFLTHHILINIDIRKIGKKKDEDDPMAKKGLPYLLHRKVYKDAFLMHDETRDDPQEKDVKAEMRAIHGDTVDIEDPDAISNEELIMPDTRRELMDTWGRLCPQKYQPFWKIRNYFGEKIALYFAWVGVLLQTLWIPMLFGFGVSLYGMYLSGTARVIANSGRNTTSDDVIGKITGFVDDSLGVIKEAFDNAVTPYYALVICLWGTIFLEVWKRRNATLSYEWDVDNFEDNEVDRPQFIGTKVKPDPVILGEETWYYPMSQQFMKFLASFSTLIMMIIVVFIAAGSVILYRVFVTLQYCGDMSSAGCLVITTVASSLLNGIAILILGRVYDLIAVKLTDWENHRTQTQYDDALILKLFAFQFANSYTSCFYIAFLRGLEREDGLFGLGPEYQDSCGSDGNCMAMLSFQVLILMLIKPFPKLLKDIILPWLKKMWRTRKCCRRRNKVEMDNDKVKMQEYLDRERLKPPTGDVTVGEYTEKVILYGFLMLFAASFPLAPLIALIICIIDIRVDARRLLWMYRRPVPCIAQDIGMWYGILQFLNFVGVISNAFLIAFTSAWGHKYNTTEKLIIVIVFEHLVFVIKFVLDALIPDQPGSVTLSKKREKYQVSRIMQDAHEQNMKKKVDMVLTGNAPTDDSRRPHSIAEEDEAPADMVSQEDEMGLLPRHRKKKSKKSRGSDIDPIEADQEDPYNEGKGNKYRKKQKPGNDNGADSEPDNHDNLRSVESPRTLPSLNRKSNLPPLGKLSDLSYGPGGDTFIGEEDKFPGEILHRQILR